MPKNSMLKTCGAFLFLFCLAAAASAEVRLPAIFGDHMVLQADMPLPVWGWADPGEQVTVTLADQSQTITADADGKWSVKLVPIKAGGPYELKVSGKNTLDFTDVLAGEVWLGSGQSNMEMAVGGVHEQGCRNRRRRLSANPLVHRCQENRPGTAEQLQRRVASVHSQHRGAFLGYASISSAASCTSSSSVPVGLIHSSWGGTPIETWIGMPSSESTPELVPLAERFKKAAATFDPDAAAASNTRRTWPSGGSERPTPKTTPNARR